MKTFILPSIVTHLTFQHLVLELKSVSISKLTLDFGNCKEGSIDSFLGYLNLKRFCKKNNILLSEKSNGSPVYLKFIDLNRQSLEIFPVENSITLAQDADKCKEHIERKIGKNRYDLSGIKKTFSELYMNIYQHSADDGLICVSCDDREIVVSCIDFGEGLVNKIRAYYENEAFGSDRDVIEFASKEGVTTKTTKQNQGKGLSNFCLCVDNHKGSFEIHSGYGVFTNSKTVSTQSVFPFEGTLLKGTFLIADLDIYYQEDFEEDINF